MPASFGGALQQWGRCDGRIAFGRLDAAALFFLFERETGS
jgi:hypothetical protein